MLRARILATLLMISLVSQSLGSSVTVTPAQAASSPTFGASLSAARSAASPPLQPSTFPLAEEEDSQVPSRQAPTAFELNQGQVAAPVQFLYQAPGGTIFFTPAEAVMALYPMTSSLDLAKPTAGGAGDPMAPPAEPSVARLRWVGANSSPILTGTVPLPGVRHYFLGNDPANWYTDIPTYASLVYKDLYPGIDLVYDTLQGALKSTYWVAPGADPSLIAWEYGGADSVTLDSEGNLVIQISPPPGQPGEPITITEHTPQVWQDTGAATIPVKSAFDLQPDGSIHFALNSYDPTQPLIIDPILTYSTYLGTAQDDEAYGLTHDDGGNIYITGYTASISFPQAGPAATSWNAFVTKLDASGTRLLYTTTFGGANEDISKALALDSTQRVYITGSTKSADFPLIRGYAAHQGNGDDVFVARLTAGGRLDYSTCLGTYWWGELGTAIAVGPAGQTYVTGSIGCPSGGAGCDFPLKHPIQAQFGGWFTDAFVAELDPAQSGANSLLYSTYLGGNGGDGGRGITTDPAGRVYVTGVAGSEPTGLPTTFPLTSNAYDNTLGGGADAFLTIVKADWSGWEYSTFLGGGAVNQSGNQDEGNGIVRDSAGYIYVTGTTWSAGPSTSNPFPTTTNAYQDHFAGGVTDAFVTKFSPSGTALVYSTYLGGSDSNTYDDGRAITVDSQGYATVVGETNAPTFPRIQPLQSSTARLYDAFVTQLNLTGTGVEFSSNLGGGGNDHAYAVTATWDGVIWLAGDTDSNTTNHAPPFPVVNAYQGVNRGGKDAFISQVTPGTIACLGDEQLGAAATCATQFAANGINTLTGNFWYQSTDLAVPGAHGTGLSFSRSYNSLAGVVGQNGNLVGPLGPGWTHSYNIFIDIDTAGRHVHLGDGSELTFPLSGAPPARFGATLTRVGSQYHLLTTHGQTLYVFNSDLRLASIQDRNGYVTTLGYGASGRLADVTEDAHAGGRSLHLTYENAPPIPNHPRITKVELKVNGATYREVTFAYSGAYNGQVTDWQGLQTEFTYYNLIHDDTDALHTIGDTGTPALTMTYDRARYTNRVQTQEDPDHHLTRFDFVPLSYMANVTDPKGFVTRYTYSAQRLQTVIRNPGSVSSTRPQATWTYEYSAVFPTGVERMTDPKTHVWQTLWDAVGNVTDTTDPEGNHTHYEYWSDNTLKQLTPPWGTPITYAYDVHGNLEETKRYWPEHAQTVTTRLYHDDALHPGDVTRMKDGRGNIWIYSYDQYGYPLTMTSPSPVNHTTTTAYDPMGRQTQVVTQHGYTTTYDYDDRPGGGSGVQVTVRTTQDPLNAITVLHYNGHGQLDQRTDPPNNNQNQSNTTAWQYLPGGALQFVIHPDFSQQEYQYDANGNLERSINETTFEYVRYEYDSFNQPQLMAVSEAQGPEHQTQYHYDLSGNLDWRIDPNGERTDYTYYGNNRLKDIQYANNNTPDVHFAYYPTGDRLTMQEAGPVGTFTTTYQHDQIGNLTTVARSGSSVPMIVAYDYDANGNRTELTYPGNKTLTLHYDAANRLDQMAPWVGNAFTFQYDDDNRLEFQTYPNSRLTQFSYDAANRLRGINHQFPFMNFSYTPYPSGDTQTADWAGREPQHSYQYDNRDRLREAASDRTITWEPNLTDALDHINITQSGQPTLDTWLYYTVLGSGTLDERTIWSNNQLVSDTRYDFNANGDRQKESDAVTGAKLRVYTYDQEDRLTQLVTSDGAVSTYSYNGDGLRVRKTYCANPPCSASIPTQFVWDEGTALPQLLQDNQADYIYGPTGDLVMSVALATDAARYYHPDRLGSIRAISDNQGTLTAVFTYDAYGTRTRLSGTEDTPFGFTGQYTDAETKLVYLRARYYDPSTYQFLTRDPANPVRPYSYTDGNPLNATDRSGLQSCGQGECPENSEAIVAAAGGPRAGGRRGSPSGGVGTAGGGSKARISGPWVNQARNVRPGGAVCQSSPGSCVSAVGEMLTASAITERELLAQIGEFSNQDALARVLNQRAGIFAWDSGIFASAEDAVRAAELGPMGAVLYAPRVGGRIAQTGHMVVIEPLGAGNFRVLDPLPGVTYEVGTSWIQQYVVGGIWRNP